MDAASCEMLRIRVTSCATHIPFVYLHVQSKKSLYEGLLSEQEQVYGIILVMSIVLCKYNEYIASHTYDYQQGIVGHMKIIPTMKSAELTLLKLTYV